MEMLLVIASNDKCWDKDEWDTLFNHALENQDDSDDDNDHDNNNSDTKETEDKEFVEEK